MKKILGILGTITITGSGMTGLVGNAPVSTKNEVNYQQTNNLETLKRTKRGFFGNVWVGVKKGAEKVGNTVTDGAKAAAVVAKWTGVAFGGGSTWTWTAVKDGAKWTWTAVDNVGRKCFGSTKDTLETSFAMGTTVGGAVASGAATGAATGTALPVAGTAVGAVIGGVAAGIASCAPKVIAN